MVQMNDDSRASGLTNQWWRLTGAAGIGWIVLFFLGAFFLQGDSPTDSDSIQDIRQYFADNATQYAVGDFLIAIGFIFFFLTFAVGLRWVLGPTEKGAPILSWLATIGAVSATIIGGLSGVPFGALTLAEKNGYQLDDSTVRALVLLDAYAFNLLGFAAALFVGAASAVMVRAGKAWTWLGTLGLISAVLMVAGAAWPIDGDSMGAVAAPGFIGMLLLLLWVIITSIALVVRRTPPFDRGELTGSGTMP
jgi:hypothetical protein